MKLAALFLNDVITEHPVSHSSLCAVLCPGLGHFVADPADQCRYLVCVYDAAEPWPDRRTGRVPLVALSRRCGPGTAVPAAFTSGARNPCTMMAPECGGGPGKVKLTASYD